MTLDILEKIILVGGALFALFTLTTMLAGIWRGIHQATGKEMGIGVQLLHSPVFYLVTAILFFGACYLLWIPLPVALSPGRRSITLLAGVLLYFPGMFFVLWGRLALGRMYFVSTGMGAHLFADHRLVTTGPFSIVRHPVYSGLSMAILGGLFLFQTWTMIFLLLLPFGLARRARIEEKVLSARFGSEWQDYCHRVPAFIPRLTKKADLRSGL